MSQNHLVNASQDRNDAHSPPHFESEPADQHGDTGYLSNSNFKLPLDKQTPMFEKHGLKHSSQNSQLDAGDVPKGPNAWQAD